MAEQELFRGFFSYARHDGETDPGLITALTTELERRINALLVNTRFEIWRDVERLKIGERWDETIDAQLRSADVLIVLLTPRWIGSEHCRKEFTVFEELETSRGGGKYVAPVLARPIDQQERRLTPEQRDILGRINQRQHFQALATNFLRLPKARRNAEIDKIAKPVAERIEQLSDRRRPRRVFLVSFDSDKYNITREGQQIIQLVALQYKADGSVRLQDTGSERRAKAVANALSALGVARSDMALMWRENDLFMPVAWTRRKREQFNRRVEILFP